ncbi:hypothetical protein AYO39_01870 [Actinobacteria bacterium SCGC AG-212-D09]|nr:hypothetical protein AYO39_01870 [Actinobacteria bacterium SCGC AG-212-D09]
MRDQARDRMDVIRRDRGRAARLVPEREDPPNVLQARGTNDDLGGARVLGQAGNGSRAMMPPGSCAHRRGVVQRLGRPQA